MRGSPSYFVVDRNIDRISFRFFFIFFGLVCIKFSFNFIH